MARDDLIQATGTVDKILGGGRYQITLENGKLVTAQLSGRMRRFGPPELDACARENVRIAACDERRGESQSLSLEENVMNTFADPLSHARRSVPDRIALVCGTERESYRELYVRCRKLAGGLYQPR